MFKNLLKLYKNSKLLTQISIVTFVLVFFMVIIGFVLFNYFSITYNKMLSTQISTILSLATKSSEKEINEIEKLTTDIMTDVDFQNNIKILTDDIYDYNDYIALNQLSQILIKKKEQYAGSITSIAVLDNHYGILNAMDIKWNTDKSDIIKQRLTPEIRKHVWIEPDETHSLSIVKNIYYTLNPELSHIGVLVIGVNIDNIINRNLISDKEYKFDSLVMSNDNVIYTDFPDNIKPQKMREAILEAKSQQKVIKVDNQRYFSISSNLEPTNWNYVVYITYDNVFRQITQNMIIISFIFLILIILSVGITYFLSENMARPVLDLSNQINLVNDGIFEGVKIDKDKENSKNEVDILAKDFNIMIDTLNKLINDNFLKKILLQETELKLLQSQINPHFLYNTLESISRMSKSGRNEEVTTTVQILGKLLRNTINNVDMVISLKEELELLKYYTYIQKIRFEDRLILNISVEEMFYKCKVPKLSLQPLVENSIKYSLERFKKTCIIDIYAKLEVNSAKIYIKDNGQGIEKEQLMKIMENQPIDSPSGIALKNIKKRLQVAFADEAAFEIESKTEVGTTIIITVPYKDY